MRTVGYLRCDAGAPTHALLSAPRWGGPPKCLRAVTHPYAAFWHGPLGAWGRVAPRRKPTSWDGLAPGLLALCSSLTGVVVVAGPWTRAAAPLCPLRAICVMLMGDPTARGPWEAVAEALRRDVSQHHVAKSQAHALWVEGLDFSGLTLQQATDPLCALVLQGQHLLFDLWDIAGDIQSSLINTVLKKFDVQWPQKAFRHLIHD